MLCLSNQEFEHHAATDWDPVNCIAVDFTRLQNTSPLQTRTLKMQSRSAYVQMYSYKLKLNTLPLKNGGG